MELTLLTVADCPNATVFQQRLGIALTAYPDAVLRHRVVADEAEAVEAGMAGSPTLLIDGADPFAVPGQVAGLCCRIYRDEAGHPAGAPSAAAIQKALRKALERAGG